MFQVENIDSIRIQHNQKVISLNNYLDLKRISNSLRSSKKIDITQGNINTDFIDVDFYIRKKNTPQEIRILYNYYNGVIITNHYTDYKNDSFHVLIKSYLQ